MKSKGLRSSFPNVYNTTGHCQKKSDIKLERKTRFTHKDTTLKKKDSYFEFIDNYLTDFRNSYNSETVISIFNRMAEIKVLILGDVIIDEYHYCHPLGISSKDPILAVQYDSHERFAGGVLATGNHIANFAGNVTLSSILGDNISLLDYIKKALHPKIKSCLLIKENSPVIIKKRYVDGYTMNKMFEVYIMDDLRIAPSLEKEYLNWLTLACSHHDIVLVNDFGHGALNDKIRKQLVKSAPFLSVNTQANAGNRGFHTISKFSKAHFVSLAEHELLLEMRDMQSNLESSMDEIAERMCCDHFVLTRGNKGSLIRDKDGCFYSTPAFAQNGIDRIGAGDALFAISSLAAFLKVPPEVIGFIGNVVGTIAVDIVGNKTAVKRSDVIMKIQSLLQS